MNRSVVSTALVFVVSLIVMGLSGCQQALDTNRNAALATATPAKETVDAAAIEAEVMQLARDWMKAGQTYDAEIIKRVVADDAILVYPDGTSATKADELRLIEAKSLTAESWDMLEPKVTVMSADSAFISGRSVIKNGKYKDPNVSRPIDISGEYRFLDVYSRRNGKWQVIASQATKVTAPAPAPTATRTP
jgi:ketosteroid isomerase-like protein